MSLEFTAVLTTRQATRIFTRYIPKLHRVRRSEVDFLRSVPEYIFPYPDFLITLSEHNLPPYRLSRQKAVAALTLTDRMCETSAGESLV